MKIIIEEIDNSNNIRGNSFKRISSFCVMKSTDRGVKSFKDGVNGKEDEESKEEDKK